MKCNKDFALLNIAVLNLKAQKTRTVLMLLFVFIMSSSFFFSSFITKNLETKIDRACGRFGSDMIAVSGEAESAIAESVFAGKPCTVWFKKSCVDEIRNVDGVIQASPQLYIGTLAASCCTSESQLIAFDPKTDFTVQSWFDGTEAVNLKKGEVIIGSGIAQVEGGTIRFYNTDFKVVKQLEHTGMGYDNSVFMTYETANMLKHSDEAKKNMDVDKIDKSASMILIKTKSGLTGGEKINLTKAIYRSSMVSMKIFTAEEMLSGISMQINQLSGYGRLLTILIIVSTALALICVFVITMNGRKYEFGILNVVGADRKQIKTIVVAEAMIICVVGGILGILTSMGLIAMFSDVLSVAMNVSSFDVYPSQILAISGFGMLLTIATGIIAAFISAENLCKNESYGMIQEGR